MELSLHELQDLYGTTRLIFFSYVILYSGYIIEYILWDMIGLYAVGLHLDLT